MKKIIVGAKIITENEILNNHVIVFNEVIEAIIHESDIGTFDGEIINFDGYVSPGFVDIHIHGANGNDVMDCSKEAIENIGKSILMSGTTAFLPTTMTMEKDKIINALDCIREVMKEEGSTYKGAKVLGVHLEGPFINPEFKGAQDEKNILKPSVSLIKNHMDIIKMITLAPEMDEDFKFIRSMKNKGIILSMGHTGIDFETACDAYDEGVTHITHCFNTMTGLHHRRPGAIGASLTKPFTLDVISDGVHIHEGFIGTFVKMKTVDKTILITDSIRASYLEDGDYDLGGQTVKVDNGCCKLSDGTIAGSILTMDKALRNIRDYTDFEIYEIVKMLSLNPAKKLGFDNEIGSLKTGKKADLVLLSNELKVEKVFIEGHKVYTGGKNEYSDS